MINILIRSMHQSTTSQYSAQDREDNDISITEESNVDHTLGDSSVIVAHTEQEGKKALNWKKYLKDEKVALDALKFQKGRNNLHEDHPYKSLAFKLIF